MIVAAWLWLAAGTAAVMASEYPERECCDPVNPPPAPDYAAAAAAGQGTGGGAATQPAVTAVDGHRGNVTGVLGNGCRGKIENHIIYVMYTVFDFFNNN